MVQMPQPVCAEFIDALANCRKSQSLGAWLGGCSGAESDLARCLAAEKSLRLRHQAREGSPPAFQKQRLERASRGEEAARRAERAELEADCFSIFLA